MAVAGYGTLTATDGSSLAVSAQSTSFARTIALTVIDSDQDMSVAVLTEQEAKALINCMAQAIRALG